MAIRVYQGERASHTHENRMLDSFIEAVRPRWERSEGSLILISNAYWNQAEIDLVCILEKALVVIDFKAYSGRITVSENGPWRKGNVEVAGGARRNPLLQVKHNKFALMDWLRSRDLLKHCNLGHISGAVVFEGTIDVEGDLPPQVSKWFSVVAMNDVASYLNSLASPEISIPEEAADGILTALAVPEYLWAPHQIVNITTSDEDADSRVCNLLPAIDSQNNALKAIKRFINDDSSHVLSISGMTSTGKSSLIPRMKALDFGSRSVIALAPNSRLAATLTAKHSVQASSIYRHIYDTKARPKREKGENGPVEVLPLRADDQDREDCIYVLDDAHLVTDTYFEPEPGKRFGSGRLVKDFLEYAKLGRTARKVVLLSDPYHITQARVTDQFPNHECWERHDVSGQSIWMDQLIRRDSSAAILDNAQRLVRCIDEGDFTEFDFSAGNGLEVKDGKTAASQAAEVIQANPKDILLIAYSNDDVAKLNEWARRERFNKSVHHHAVPGDLLEIYTFVSGKNPLESGSLLLSPGDLEIVESAAAVQRYEQPLKGREKAVEFSLQQVSFSGSEEHQIPLLIDFLISENKEIDSEIQIAIKVWADRPENTQPVNARFGYAATAHHARALRRARVVIAPPDSMGRHNETYFRWLYSAITRAEQEAVIASWKPLNVFDQARFSRESAGLHPKIPIGSGLSFDPERPPTPEECDLSAPDGLDPSSPAFKSTIAIWLALRPVFEALGLKIIGVQGHAYQVHFTIVNDAGETHDFKVHYTGENKISNIRAESQPLLMEVCEGIVQRIQLSAEKRRIVSSLPKLSGLDRIRLLSLRYSDYRLILVLGHESDGLAEMELNHDGDGMVSSIRCLKFTDERIVKRLSSALE